MTFKHKKHTLAPGNFPFTGLSESKSWSYLALSVAVTAQFTVFVWTPDGGEVKENEPTEEVVGIADTFGIIMGGCSPWKLKHVLWSFHLKLKSKISKQNYVQLNLPCLVVVFLLICLPCWFPCHSGLVTLTLKQWRIHFGPSSLYLEGLTSPKSMWYNSTILSYSVCKHYYDSMSTLPNKGVGNLDFLRKLAASRAPILPRFFGSTYYYTFVNKASVQIIFSL